MALHAPDALKQVALFLQAVRYHSDFSDRSPGVHQPLRFPSKYAVGLSLVPDVRCRKGEGSGFCNFGQRCQTQG